MRALPASAVLVAIAACQPGTTDAPPPGPGGKLELVEAPATPDIAAYVAPRVAEARSAGKTLLVYVGATWCEPCQYFHAAAAAGKLDAPLGDLRLLAFDLDRDGDALAAAGYRSAMIPLFALPGVDGRASGKQIAGSIKGDAAVAQITPRLRQLVAGH